MKKLISLILACVFLFALCSQAEEKQGKLKEEDILGEAYYQIADGTISAGTVINLRTVQIANKVLHNVQATVVDNLESPLLLGQSALSRFGEISIDYNNLTIEFK